jgi:hypothetical protein
MPGSRIGYKVCKVRHCHCSLDRTIANEASAPTDQSKCESLTKTCSARARLAHARFVSHPKFVDGEARPAVSASQRARWCAGGGVRQRSAPLPMVCNCNRSIVANGLYPHTPDHHDTRLSTSAWLPCATLRKSLPPPVVWLLPVRSSDKLRNLAPRHCGEDERWQCRAPNTPRSLIFFANGRPQHFDLGQEHLNLCSSSCRSVSFKLTVCPPWPSCA